MNQNASSVREIYSQIREVEKKIFPPVFNMDKKDVIDYAFTRCNVRPATFADLGGVWGVNGAYTFYALEQYDVGRAYLVDTNFTDAVKNRAVNHPQLQTITGNFGDFDLINKSMPPVDAVFFFDVLLHQVKPDWNEVLAFYASKASLLVIYNQQFTLGTSTVRLFDLGPDGYFENVPHSRLEAPYNDLFEKLYEMHPQHNRIWRDVHNVWQWGITDEDLLSTVDKLGFALRYYKNCGKFGTLNNFENHMFVFEKR